jgi:hypothetical protein
MPERQSAFLFHKEPPISIIFSIGDPASFGCAIPEKATTATLKDHEKQMNNYSDFSGSGESSSARLDSGSISIG